MNEVVVQSSVSMQFIIAALTRYDQEVGCTRYGDFEARASALNDFINVVREESEKVRALQVKDMMARLDAQYIIHP